MYFDYAITVPAGTALTDPLITRLELTYGIITDLDIAFPPGCAALVHVAIYRFNHQLWPSNPEASFAWDNFTIRITGESYPLTTPPFHLAAHTWSLDNAFDHTITLRVGIHPPEPHRAGTWIKRLFNPQGGRF